MTECDDKYNKKFHGFKWKKKTKSEELNSRNYELYKVVDLR